MATIGHEGMVGLPVYLGAISSPQAAFCQVPGDSARIGVDDFRRALSRGGIVHALLNRFTQATMVQIAPKRRLQSQPPHLRADGALAAASAPTNSHSPTSSSPECSACIGPPSQRPLNASKPRT